MQTPINKFNEYVQQYIDYKHACGIEFHDGESMVRRFSKFCEPLVDNKIILIKDNVTAWFAIHPSEHRNTWKIRCNYIAHFLKWLAQRESNIYVPPCVKQKQLSFTPHIYTNDELERFFFAAERLKDHASRIWYYDMYPNHSLMAVTFFRLLYGCGLRLNEAIHLRIKDVDLSNGIITVLQAKGGKDRLVPVHTGFLPQLQEYSKIVNIGKGDELPFFQSPAGGFYDDSTIYSTFRKCLKAAGIPHLGRGRGPRIHDFRHTFAVHCLRNWVKTGADITTALPYLSAYMGHRNIDSSQYYLRLTADMYPYIVQKMEEKFDLLSALEGYYEET